MTRFIMLEYQGWIVIRESLNERDESDELMEEIWHNLAVYVDKINSERGADICQMKITNGNYKLMIGGLDNRKTSSWTKLVEFFNWIAVEAKGSYGLVHFLMMKIRMV